MDELNMHMEEAATSGSAQDLQATYESHPTVVIFEGMSSDSQPTTAGATSTQAAAISADPKSCKFWTHEATILLIELYKSYHDSMKDPRIKKKDVWNRIAAEMAAHRFNFHGDMCDKKWRNLKKSYYSVLESKSVPGQTRRLWQYFDILNDVFSKEHNSNDVASGTGINSANNNNDANGTNLVGRSGSSSTSKTGKSRSKVAISAASSADVIPPDMNDALIQGVEVVPPEVLEVALTDGALEDMSPMQALKVMLDRQERSEEKRMNRMMVELRKMHDENLEVMHERNVLLHRLIEQLSSGT